MERNFAGIFVHEKTLHCALDKCLPCCYKINPSGVWNVDNKKLIKLPPNQRPECCLRFKNAEFGGFYDRKQRIVTIGDGDFSYSLSLARFFDTKAKKKLVCTSHESLKSILATYPTSPAILEELAALKVTVMHEVDATALQASLTSRLPKSKRFDVVVWNFPCVRADRGADGQVDEIDNNITLLRNFFTNVGDILRSKDGSVGEVHVTHKTLEPFCWWDITKIAAECHCQCLGSIVFDR